MILCIDRICFYPTTYKVLLVSLLYSKNATHKYLRYLAKNNIKIYFALKYISLIDMCPNYYY
jgi:hypothetical protein